MRCAGVEPDTEHSFLLFCSDSAPVMSVLSALHQQALSGDQVRPGEGDLLLAGVGDRVGRGDELDLVVLDQRLALAGRRFLPLDLVLGL